MQRILTVAQMRDAETRAMKAGISGRQMMQSAGEAVANVVAERFTGREVIVVCGSGNNGGDGYVAAEALRRQGHKVSVLVMTPQERLKGDAQSAARAYQGEVVLPGQAVSGSDKVIVDALYGTGLSRAPEGEACALIEAIHASGATIVAVDLPSGVLGDTGATPGVAVRADVTVAFAARKPGHVFMPGAACCGEIIVVDIGIGSQVKDAEGMQIFENRPALWGHELRWPDWQSHKYTRGKALVVGGGIASTGAARLAAQAALRSGAGLVTVLCDRESLPVYAAQLTAVMTEVAEDQADFLAKLADKRVRAVLIGPGNGVTPYTRSRVNLALGKAVPSVLDADALNVFAGEAEVLSALIHAPTVLTPHEGEFARLFPAMSSPSRTAVERASEAARKMNAVIVLKGANTVVAEPMGRVAMMPCASAWLATAGSGDVLSGIITGYLAQGMPAFEAASAGVWTHAEAAARLGPGIIAEDLVEGIRLVTQLLISSLQ